MIENLKPLYQKFEEAVKGEDNEHGGVKRYMALEDHLRKVISCTVEKLCS